MVNGDHLKNRKQACLFLTMLWIGSSFLAADSVHLDVVAIAGVTLLTPVPFSQATSIGLDAYSSLYPAAAKPGSEAFEIALVFFSAQMQSETGFSEREMHNYARSTFLALGTPPETSKTRKFAGKEIKGNVDATSIPRPARWESYLLSLADGRKLVLAFKASAAMDKSLAEQIIVAAAASFTEIK
jgi:hypothetical protein